jgi:hypothetical protein
MYHKFYLEIIRNLLLMRKFDSSKQALYVIAAIGVLLFSSYNNQQIFGHNFAGDESLHFGINGSNAN